MRVRRSPFKCRDVPMQQAGGKTGMASWRCMWWECGSVEVWKRLATEAVSKDVPPGNRTVVRAPL